MFHVNIVEQIKHKVNEFAIGFGPIIWKKEGKETKYALRLIPLGGFVSMEGEDEESENERSFSKASIPKRIAIVAAGAIVNILFGLVAYFILVAVVYKDVIIAFQATEGMVSSIFESLKMLFTGNIGIKDLSGPIGISNVVSNTTTLSNYIYIISVISISLGVTNLLPIPALDGGKILLLITEAIRRKPLKKETEIQIQLIGFSVLIALSLIVTYNDIIRIAK